MDFDKACGIERPHAIDYNEKIDRYIDLLGYENLKKFLPRSREELYKAYKKDRHFNNIPLVEWEKAAGYNSFSYDEAYKNRHVYGSLPRCSGAFLRLLESHGVTVFSMSECVSILKHTAERWILERLDSIYEDHWAVFEAWGTNRDKAHQYDIFCFDCVAVFPDEKQAIDFESKNPANRVRRLIRGNGPAMLAKENKNNVEETGNAD